MRIHSRSDELTLESRSRKSLKKAEDYVTAFLDESQCATPLLPLEDEPGAIPPPREDLPPEPGAKLVTLGRKTNIYVRTPGQGRFYECVQKNDLVFVVGPAGTGKTYLAVAMAIEALRTRAADRIVLARPAVEAGESLGFLPGNLKEKVDPYLAPLYDALYDILPREAVARYFEDKVIEVSPLAYMRGRTLHNAFIILDEAQNATVKQLKMFLTRLGRGSKAVVAGDITQIDLAADRSGLLTMEHILSGIPGIGFATLNSTDVLRHRLVKDIIDAYEDFERKHGG